MQRFFMPAGSWAEVDTLPHEKNLDKNPLIYPHKHVEICLQIQINTEGFFGLFLCVFFF